MNKLKELFKRTAAAAAPHALRALAAACLVSAAVALTAPAAHAEGTRDLYETGEANYEEIVGNTTDYNKMSRINFYGRYGSYKSGTTEVKLDSLRNSGGVVGGQKIKFYAYEGEVVFIGTSATPDDIEQPFITITTPDVSTVTVNFNNLYNVDIDKSVGYIATHDQEMAGPYLGDGKPQIHLPKINKETRKSEDTYTPTTSAGYTPYEYKITQSGVYTVELFPPVRAGLPNDSQAALSDTDFSEKNSKFNIMAWDITVTQPKDEDENDIKCTDEDYESKVKSYYAFSGRVWATALTMQWNNRGGYGYLYTVTNDGYIWRLGFNGIIPYTCSLYANRRGVVGISTNASAYHSFHEPMSNQTSFEAYKTLKDKNGNADGVRIIGPDTYENDLDAPYKMFFNYPSTTLPKSEVNVKDNGTPNGNDGQMGKIEAIRFDGRNNGDSDVGGPNTSYGSAKDPNDYGTVGVGGYFEVNTGKATSYRIIIDMSNMYAANYHGEEISKGKYYDYKDGEKPGNEEDDSHIHEEEICLSTDTEENFIFYNKENRTVDKNQELLANHWYSIRSVNDDRHPQTDEGDIVETLVQVAGDGTSTQKKQFTYDTSKVITFVDITKNVTGTSGNEEVTIDGKTFKSLGVIMLGNSAVEGIDDRINWDGRDQYGRILPVGKYFGDTGLGEVYVQAKMGEVHFPISDAEAVPNGLSVWLENPPEYVKDDEVSIRSSLYYNNVDKSLMRDFEVTNMWGSVKNTGDVDNGTKKQKYSGNNAWYWNLPSNLTTMNSGKNSTGVLLTTGHSAGQIEDNSTLRDWKWNEDKPIYSSWADAIKANKGEIPTNGNECTYAIYENMSVSGVASYEMKDGNLSATGLAAKFLNSCGSDHGVIDVWTHVVDNEKVYLDDPIILSHTSHNVIVQGFVYLEVTNYSTNAAGETTYDRTSLGKFETYDTSDHGLEHAMVHAYYGTDDAVKKYEADGTISINNLAVYDTETNTDGFYSIPIDTSLFGGMEQGNWKVHIDITYSSPESPNAVTHYVTTAGAHGYTEDPGHEQKWDTSLANKVHLTVSLASKGVDANNNPMMKKTFSATNVGYYAEKKQFPLRIQKIWSGEADSSLRATYTILGFKNIVNFDETKNYYVNVDGNVYKKTGAAPNPETDVQIRSIDDDSNGYVFIRQNVPVDEKAGGLAIITDLPQFVYKGSSLGSGTPTAESEAIICYVAVEEAIGGSPAKPEPVYHNNKPGAKGEIGSDVSSTSVPSTEYKSGHTELDGTKYDYWEFTNIVEKGSFSETVYVDSATQTTTSGEGLSYKYGNCEYDNGEGCAEAKITIYRVVNGAAEEEPYVYTLSTEEAEKFNRYIEKHPDSESELVEKYGYEIHEGETTYYTISIDEIPLNMDDLLCPYDGIINLQHMNASTYKAIIVYPSGENYTEVFENGSSCEGVTSASEDKDTHTVTQEFTIGSGGNVAAEVGIGRYRATAKLGSGSEDSKLIVNKTVTCEALDGQEFPFGKKEFNYQLDFVSFEDADGAITPDKGVVENSESVAEYPAPYELSAANPGATLSTFGSTVEMKKYTEIIFKAAGTYTFKLKEEIPADANKIPGMKYDEKVYTVIFTVENQKTDGVWKPVITSSIKLDGGSDVEGNTVTFNNVYNTGTVTVTKEVAGTGAPDDDEFTFKVGLKDSSDKPLSGNFNISSPDSTLSKITNDGTFTLKKGKSATILLPDGANVTITEDNYDAYVTTVDGSEESSREKTVTIDKDTPQSVTFTNTFKSGKLKITEKFVDEDSPDGHSIATVKLTLPASFNASAYNENLLTVDGLTTVSWTKDGSVITGTIDFTNATKTPASSEIEITISGIPAGTAYDVSVRDISIEPKSIPDGYVHTMKTGASGNIAVPKSDDDVPNAVLIFTPDPKVTIDIKKQITGEPTTKEYTFAFTAAKAGGNDCTTSGDMGTSITVDHEAKNLSGTGAITFDITSLDDFSGSDSEEFEFTVKEDPADYTGIECDKTTHNVTVTIAKSKDGTGTLSVDVKNGDAAVNSSEPLVFTNHYTPVEATAHINVTKNLKVPDGEKAMPTNKAKTFTINFAGNGVAPDVVKSITVTGSGDLYTGTETASVTFDKAGTYVYTVTEKNDGARGVSYSDEEYKVEFVVIDEEGTLTVKSYTINGGTQTKLSSDNTDPVTVDGITFTNEYTPQSVTTNEYGFTGTAETSAKFTKTLKTEDGVDIDFDDGVFSFDLSIEPTDGASLSKIVAKNVGKEIPVGPITFTKAGTYVLTVSEDDDGKDNITYDPDSRTVTYEVVDNEGQLEVTATCTDTVFKNTCKPAELTMQIDKTLTVADGVTNPPTGFTFNFEKGNIAPAIDPITITVVKSEDGYKGTGSTNVEFTHPGNYTYTVGEGDTGTGMRRLTEDYTVTVEVSSSSRSDPGLVTNVTISGGDTGAKLSDDGKTVILPFANSYNPESVVSDPVVITKIFETADKKQIKIKDKDFSFKASLTKDDGETTADGACFSDESTEKTIQNDGEKVNVGGITFTKEGTYKLIVEEILDTNPHVTYDESKIEITYTVSDSNGQLTVESVLPESLNFTNTYTPDPITFNIVKNLNVPVVGGELASPTDSDFEFRFNGTAPEINPVTVKVAPNSEEGKYTGTQTTDVTFTQPGTYTYTISEVNDGATGMTYSKEAYIVTVVVENTPDAPGLTTTITVKDEDDNPVPGTVNGNAITLPFENTYKPLPTSTEQIPHDEEDEEDDDDEFYNRANVVITKTLKTAAGTDVDFKDGDFSFTATLTAADGTSLTNDEAYFDNHLDAESLENVGGKVTVGNITFTKAGKYKLTVSENKGENADITYDSRKISVIYTVAENSGRLEILSAETGDEYLFANIFTPHPVAVTPSLHKSLINTFSGNDRLGVDNTRGFYDGRFSFTLTAADGNPDGAEIKMPTAENITVEAGDGKAKYENVAFTDGIKFTREGSYTFTIAENIPADAVIDSATGRLISADGKFAFVEGQTVTVTYTVTADRTGQLVATAVYSPASPVITNYYNYNPCLLTVTNEITAADGVKIHENQAFEYVVELWDRDGNPYSGELVYSKASAAPAAIALPMAGDGSDIQTMRFIDGVNAEPIMLASGAGIEFEGIPDGFSFAVTQKPYPAEVGDAYELTGIELGGTADAESIVSERKAAGSFNAEDDTATVRFINNYSLTPVKASPKAGKQVVWNNDGTPIDMTENYGGAFEFGLELLSAEHEDGAEILSDTAVNDEKGNIAFTDAIEFTNEGVYIFSVYEKTPESPDPHITYTSQRFTVTYTVTADIAGRLSAAAVYDSDPVFENEFSPVPCTLTVINTVDGDYIHAEKEFEYELTLTNADGTPFEGSLPYRTGKPAPQLATPMASGETKLQFIGGKASFTLRHLESITIYSIDDGISYSVTQKDYSAEGYTGSAAAAVNGVADGLTVKGSFTAENVEAEADYLNIYRVKPVTPEAVTVTKKLSGKPVGDRSFEFKVSGENVDETLKIAISEGEEEANAFWQSSEYTEVGVYEYTIAEIAGTDPGMDYDTAVYTVDVTVTDNGAGQLEAAVAVAKDGAEAEGIVFENFYNSGVLTVEKKVTGSAGDTEKEFDFTVKIDGLSGVYGDMTFEDGVAQFKLKHGESMTASGLPDGVSYEVSEETDPAEGYLVTAQGETGTIKKGQRSTAIFVNHRDSASSVTAGDLVISLTVVNPRTGEENASYPFRVTLSEPISGIFDGAEFADGVSTVYLKNGDSLHIGELAAGITYTVEQAFEDETAEVSFNGETGTILAGETSRTGIYIRFTDSTEFKKPGNLTVTKTVAGAPTDAAFGFDIVLDDAGVNGVYGDMEFIGGRAHIELRHGESATAKELPSGTVYRVTETDSFGYTVTSVNASGSIPERDTAVAAFVNVENKPEFAVGDLKIVKNIAGNAANPADVFEFEIILDKDISGVYGDIEFTSGRALVSLSAGQSATARGLPAGTGYTVSEIDGGLGYISSSDGSFGFITKNAVMTASFVNTLNAPITEPLTGGLTVSKTVAGIETEARFGIDVTLTEPLEGVYGDMTFSAGVARLSLANGESATATGLPAGIGYSVSENPEDAIGFTVSGSGLEGIIPDGGYAAASVVNTAPTVPNGDLVIAKTVTGTGADRTLEFPFTVTLTDTSINGLYGELEFTNGVATVNLSHGMSAVASGLPAGVGYTVSEDSLGYTATYTGEQGTIIANGISAAAFVNRYDIYIPPVGNLYVTKQVAGTDCDSSLKFPFRVTLSDSTINGVYGDMEFVGGVAEFELSENDGEIAATGLPEGTEYLVEETDTLGYEQEAVFGERGVIREYIDSSASFINSLSIPPYGDLRVYKTVSGSGADIYDEFAFRVTLSDKSVNGTFGEMEFVNGVAEFTLSHGESRYASGLPEGVEYLVEETDPKDYRPQAVYNEGVIVKASEAKVYFINNREIPYYPPVQQTGSLSISKTVEIGEYDREFEFTVTLTDASGFPLGGSYSFGGSKSGYISSGGTVALRHGESITIYGLPAGAKYSVSENIPENYRVESSGEAGIIPANGTAAAEFKNYREVERPTAPNSREAEAESSGRPAPGLPCGLVLTALAAGAAMGIAKRKF